MRKAFSPLQKCGNCSQYWVGNDGNYVWKRWFTRTKRRGNATKRENRDVYIYLTTAKGDDDMCPVCEKAYVETSIERTRHIKGKHFMYYLKMKQYKDKNVKTERSKESRSLIGLVKALWMCQNLNINFNQYIFLSSYPHLKKRLSVQRRQKPVEFHTH